MKFLIVLVLAVATVNAARLDTLLKPAFSSGRVINGQDAKKGEAPYIVSLQQPNNDFHFCAGSLIGEHWALTAAHCLTSQTFNVVAGGHVHSDRSDIQVRKVESSKQYKTHEKYGGGVGPFDIGIIYFPDAFNLNELRDNGAPVAAISLPSGKYSQTGKGKLYGWGRDESGTSPQTLQTLDADIIGYSACKAELPFDAPIHSESNICSHTAGKIDGACNGDSGGPLIVNTADGAELVGIVSWGYTPCHWSTYPSVYTNVNTFKDWIAQNQKNF